MRTIIFIFQWYRQPLVVFMPFPTSFPCLLLKDSVFFFSVACRRILEHSFWPMSSCVQLPPRFLYVCVVNAYANVGLFFYTLIFCFFFLFWKSHHLSNMVTTFDGFLDLLFVHFPRMQGALEGFGNHFVMGKRTKQVQSPKRPSVTSSFFFVLFASSFWCVDTGELMVLIWHS